MEKTINRNGKLDKAQAFIQKDSSKYKQTAIKGLPKYLLRRSARKRPLKKADKELDKRFDKREIIKLEMFILDSKF